MSDAAEDLARQFHETYEALAPSFGYETREASAKPWEEVPEANRNLMVAVCRVIMRKLPERHTDAQTVEFRSRMWQNKAGALLTIIEEHGTPELFERACAAMNINWQTGNPETDGWDVAAQAGFKSALQAAIAADVSPSVLHHAMLRVEVMLLADRALDSGFRGVVWKMWEDHGRDTNHTNHDSDDEFEIRCRECDAVFTYTGPEDLLNEILGIIQTALRKR